MSLTVSCTPGASSVRRAATDQRPVPVATSTAGAAWRPAPGYKAEPQPVRFALVSADGRRITAIATGGGCTRDAHLSAVERADRVVLRLAGITPAVITGGCTADLLVLTRATTLSAPLGRRRLLDATTGHRVRWFDGRRLAVPGWLPPGAAAPSDRPVGSGWDRSYAFPGHRHAAPVDVTQTPTRLTRPSYRPDPDLIFSWTTVHGRPALLILQRDHEGRLLQSELSWVENDFLMRVASYPEWAWQRPLPMRSLMRVATGLRLPPG